MCSDRKQYFHETALEKFVLSQYCSIAEADGLGL